MRCRRCDWVADPTEPLSPRVQLAEHAESADHPLCVVCRHSLVPDEQQTCETPRPGRQGQPPIPSCLTRARALLSGIETMWDDVPRHLGRRFGASQLDGSRGGGDGRPLPGGDLLALFGPGGNGGATRKLTRLEQDLRERWWLLGAVGPLTRIDWIQLEQARAGAEHNADNLDTDPASVAQILRQWVEDWQASGAPGSLNLQAHTSNAHVVHAAAGYLEVHARWAARQHPVFEAYVQDLQQLHQRLELLTGRLNRTVRAEAECFGCGADALVRELRDGRPCEHGTPPPWPSEWQQLPDGKWRRVRTAAQVRQLHEQALEEWETEHGHCKRLGGYADTWTCQRCGEVYDWHRYLLALSGRLQDSDVPGWGLPEQVGYVLNVNPKTVRGWADRGQVATACLRENDRRVRVWWDDARERAEELLERRRRQAEREAGKQAERQSA